MCGMGRKRGEDDESPVHFSTSSAAVGRPNAHRVLRVDSNHVSGWGGDHGVHPLHLALQFAAPQPGLAPGMATGNLLSRCPLAVLCCHFASRGEPGAKEAGYDVTESSVKCLALSCCSPHAVAQRNVDTPHLASPHLTVANKNT